MLRRSVGEEVALANDSHLVALLDRLHDDARLEEGRLAVVGVVGESRDNALGVDVAAFVHEPARSCKSLVSFYAAKEAKGTHIRGGSGHQLGDRRRR